MTTNIERAGLVARHVQLQSITLTSANVSSSIDPLTLPEAMALSNRYRAELEQRTTGDDTQLLVRVEFEFSADRPAGEGEPSERYLHLTATLLLVYALARGATYPKDALAHFAWLNGAYNAWPYWRELVQSVTGRVGLAGIVLPVYRPNVRDLDETAHRAAPGSRASRKRNAKP